MIYYARLSIKELEYHLAIEQERLDSNPLDAAANRRWQNLVLMIKRKHVEQMVGLKQKQGSIVA